jgi:hypothetical protein
MNFKSILLAAAVGLTTLGLVPEAKAASNCELFDDFSICYEMVGRQGSYNTWNLTVINRHWSEEMQVVCLDKTMDNWSSRGGASKAQARQLAIAFCAL